MATTIRCPHCLAEIRLQDQRAGRFRSQCPKCERPFSLMLPDGADGSPIVATLQGPSTTNPSPSEPTFDPDETVSEELSKEQAAMLRPRVLKDDETVAEVRVVADLPEPPASPPKKLGGYRVGRHVGPIRSGDLFEAKRTATGQALALSLVKGRWAAQPTFVSRFVREAYAAGQLDHPNLIPPVDVDVVGGFAFTASDALAGSPLSEPRGRRGFDRTSRFAAILQTSRGLRHAHEQGIYHRDVTLDRIRIDEDGLVRLAGIGVGLTPETPEASASAPIPLAGSHPGPPSGPLVSGFVREDIGGLGRALLSLVGGSQGDRALTPGLASVIRRMVGEGPEPAFADLGGAVRAMEAELGVGNAFLPLEEDSSTLEACSRAFDEVPLARLRSRLDLGFSAVLGLFASVAMLAGRPLTALGALGFGAIVGAARVAVRGISGRDPLFDRVRELLLGGDRGDALTVLAGASLLVGTLFATGLLGFWAFLGTLAVGLAVARHYAIDRPIEQARLDPIARGRALVRSLRLHGVDEVAIRRFACREGGPRWEEFFAVLFGDEALRSARILWGPPGSRLPRLDLWREPILSAIGARLDARRRARDLAMFRQVEERSLEAKGVNLMTARRKSRRVAEAIVQFCRANRKATHEPQGPPLMDAFNRVAQRPDDYLTTVDLDDPAGPPAWREALDTLGRALFGPRARFLLGATALAGCLTWMHQNSLISAEEIKQAGLGATADREKAVADAREIGRKIAAGVQGVADASTETKALELDGVSRTITRRLDGFGLGVAGLILIASACFRGARLAAFALPGALIAALGPQLIEAGARPLGPTSLMCLAVGGGLFALGLAFGRTRG